MMCKWETPDNSDPTHAFPGTQVESQPLDGQVQFWAIVTHPVSTGSITGVYADVFAADAFLRQIELVPYMHDDNLAQVAAIESAAPQGIIAYGNNPSTATTFTFEDITECLIMGDAELYMGQCQNSGFIPGEYTVKVSAPAGSAWSTTLKNTLTVTESDSQASSASAIPGMTQWWALAAVLAMATLSATILSRRRQSSASI